MNLFTGESADEFFGGEMPAAARQALRLAAHAPREEVASLLWTAQAMAPQALGVYYVLYKHHASQRELAEAERAARRGLQEAARQAGLAADWRSVTPATLPAGVDFQGSGPARFWLFTLKALAFLSLRGGHPEEARELLATIAALDPQARIGDEVVASLLASISGGAGV
ncbi:hypothetical protein LRH25_23585 [Ideonella azotifigens]|uniref:Tetratricopeptide repeat protein n=1 Tax=Ideonella azotifigens TaxID=513160 RepID=A0ABN1JV26_9BURK|nr:hypothetical protein [Ideonella azotifigens]MCD2343313.1 hypothetical protein [Ideonella azotifigens]